MGKRFLLNLVHSIVKHNIGSLAAIIAFFGFSSLIPLLVLLMYAASTFVSEGAVERVLNGVLQSYIPVIPAENDFVNTTIERLKELRNTGIGLVGLAGLLWSTIGGFVTLQQILDTIFEVKRRRPFFLQYVVGFAMIGILLALTVVSAVISIITPEFVSKLLFLESSGLFRLIHLISKVSFPLILFVTCYSCFRILPSRKLKHLPLIIGALLATIFIYISRSLFVFYTHHLGHYQLMYGTLTFVTLLTFWIYVVCIILLFAAEVAVAIDNRIRIDSKSAESD